MVGCTIKGARQAADYDNGCLMYVFNETSFLHLQDPRSQLAADDVKEKDLFRLCRILC